MRASRSWKSLNLARMVIIIKGVARKKRGIIMRIPGVYSLTTFRANSRVWAKVTTGVIFAVWWVRTGSTPRNLEMLRKALRIPIILVRELFPMKRFPIRSRLNHPVWLPNGANPTIWQSGPPPNVYPGTAIWCCPRWASPISEPSARNAVAVLDPKIIRPSRCCMLLLWPRPPADR